MRGGILQRTPPVHGPFERQRTFVRNDRRETLNRSSVCMRNGVETVASRDAACGVCRAL